MENNIHILPTDKPRTYKGGKVSIFTAVSSMMPTESVYNIYITNSEEIKEGDWFLTDDKRVEKCAPDWRAREWHKKIILTTDQDLIKDGVQAIDDEFLEWFVKYPSCEEVEVLRYPIERLYTIIPKEEPTIVRFPTYYESKQETLEEAAQNYAVTKKNRTSHLMGFKEGANWQQQNSYSEEDMMDYSNYRLLIKKSLSPKEWFKQFKNK